MKEFEPRTCVFCGQPYLPVRSTQKYCSDKCFNTAANIRHGHKRATPLEPRTCEACGQPFIPRQKNQTVCSPKCRRWLDSRNLVRNRRSESYVRRCVICGTTFETSLKHKRTCSAKCSELLRHPKVVREPKVCPFCGKTFTPKVKQQRFCSKQCHNRSHYGYADLEEYNRVKAVRAKAAKASAERDTCGLTLAQRQEVIDAQNGDQSQLWKRSQSWTKAQHKYAKKRYEELHGLFVTTYTP